MAPGVYVTDFGLAKDIATGSRLTRSGETLGTPAYMSPEQARGEQSELSPASDVWALGCVLFELLEARPPFAGGTVAAIVAAVIQSDPLPVHGVPRNVERLIEICL